MLSHSYRPNRIPIALRLTEIHIFNPKPSFCTHWESKKALSDWPSRSRWGKLLLAQIHVSFKASLFCVNGFVLIPPEFLVDEKYKFFCFANFTFSHFFAKTKNCSFFTLTLCSFWGVWLIAITFGIYAVSNACNQLQKHGSQPCTLSHAPKFT